MPKILEFDKEARQKLLKGANTLTEAVATTLGPKGRNVAIDRSGTPIVVHDGVTVAKEIVLEDPFENMGAQLLKQAASQTNDVAGDGTTTSTVLGQAIVNEAINQVEQGANPMILKKGVEKAVETVVSELLKSSKKITTPEEQVQVATISAADQKIGEMISDAISKVGADGVITVEEGKGMETTVDHREGMEFDKGYASAYFVTDTDKMESSIVEPYILVTDKKLSSMQEFLPFLEKFVQVSKDLVIIAPEVTGEVLAVLVLNKMKGVFNPLVIEAPGFGDNRKDMLQDIAILTGARVISDASGEKFESTTVADLGRAGRITSTKDTSLIVGGKGAPEQIDARVAQIKTQIGSSDSEFDKERLQSRLAKLTGGVAVINVGAATETELKEKKERVIDAVAATKAAIEEGIVPGGEVALLSTFKALNDLLFNTTDAEEKLGIEIVRKALEQPFRKLLSNAGYDNADELLAKVQDQPFGYGYDVMDGNLKDLVSAGVIDPVKVTRSALQNAASVAMMMMTTNVLISDKPQDKPSANNGMQTIQL